MAINWTRLTSADLPHVSRIAAKVHPDFPETDAVFADRLRLYPDGCWLLYVDGSPAGYVLSHPMLFGQLPALNALLGALAETADSFYIHDLALVPDARGTGAATQIVSMLAEHAKTSRFATMSLVAVNASQHFWEKQGFAVMRRPELASKLRTYEADARFMVRKLD